MGQGHSGFRLEDKYFLQKVKLGQGSFGVVWRAVDRHSQNPVAVKQMYKQQCASRGVRGQDVEREIFVMQAINHENVTGLYDTFEDQQSIYMVLEYCDGGDFGDKVKERALNMQEPEAAEWVRQICSAVAACHSKGVCHRDIKPDNFMVHGSTLKLTDFGLAIFLAREQMLNDKCGTPAFMSPEQHQLPRNSRGYGHAVDNWAAGVSMYMLMMGGRHPFLVNGQHLDERLVLLGALDFNVQQRVFGIGVPNMGLGASDGRFTEPARDLCRRLVCPDARQRLSASQALQHPWLLNVCRVVPPQVLQQGPPQGPPPQGPPPQALQDQPSALPPWKMLQNRFAAGDLVEKLAAGLGLGNQLGQDADGRNASSSNDNEAQLQLQRLLQEEKLRENIESQYAVTKQSSSAGQQQFDKPAQPPQQPSARAPSPASTAGDRRRDSKSPQLSNGGGLLPNGAKCRYNSSSLSTWIPAVVMAVNLESKTYDLDVRPGAIPHNISPRADGSTKEAWPRGTFVFYKSSTASQWLQAVVESFNEAMDGNEGTYNLDIRESASVDRIRIRFPA